MGITKEFSPLLYSGIYHMGYEMEHCDPEWKYCLCPALHDYNDSYHLCKCVAEKEYKERMTYPFKEGIRTVKAEGSDEMCCEGKLPEKIVDLSHGMEACKVAEQLTVIGVENGQLIADVISWQITKAFYVEDSDVDFWTLYCAFHPKCLMFDICHIILALFECIQHGIESEKWLRILQERLTDYLRIYNGRIGFEEQYEIIASSIFNELHQNQVYGFGFRMFKKEICNAFQEKRNCKELLPFLVISSAGKMVFLDALEALLLVTKLYLSEWNTYGFKKNGSLAEKCSNLLKEYTHDGLHRNTNADSMYEKHKKLKPADSRTAVLNAEMVCKLAKRIMRNCQVNQYWTKM